MSTTSPCSSSPRAIRRSCWPRSDFDVDRDAIFHLDLGEGGVTLDRIPWAKQGDVTGWLVSEALGLRQALERPRRLPHATLSLAVTFQVTASDSARLRGVHEEPREPHEPRGASYEPGLAGPLRGWFRAPSSSAHAFSSRSIDGTPALPVRLVRRAPGRG